MQLLHETGHVIGALTSGGTVEQVILNPLQFSRTDLSRNPKPLYVAWSGPIFGATAPLVIVAAVWRYKTWWKQLVCFFAGFCLLANGLYLGVGGFITAGDANDILRFGAMLWQLVAFGAICTILGLVMWHRLGPKLGLVKLEAEISTKNAPLVSAISFAILLIAEIIYSASVNLP